MGCWLWAGHGKSSRSGIQTCTLQHYKIDSTRIQFCRQILYLNSRHASIPAWRLFSYATESYNIFHENDLSPIHSSHGKEIRSNLCPATDSVTMQTGYSSPTPRARSGCAIYPSRATAQNKPPTDSPTDSQRSKAEADTRLERSTPEPDRSLRNRYACPNCRKNPRQGFNFHICNMPHLRQSAIFQPEFCPNFPRIILGKICPNDA